MDVDPLLKKTTRFMRLERPQVAPELVPFLQVLSGHQAGLVILLEQTSTRLGRDEQCEVVLAETGVSRVHARLVHTEGEFEILDEDSTNGLRVNGQEVVRLVLQDGDRIGLGPECSLKFGRQPRNEVELAQRLFEGAKLDGLTRVYNRATLFERLGQELSFSERHGTPFGLLLFDIDHFKAVNDTYGHPAGDAVLRQVASRSRQFLRLEDTMGRYGGEEFVILLRNSDPAAAVQAAERLRLEIAGSPFDLDDGRQIPVTISVGVACWSPRCSQEQLLARADQALYEAKNGGRNQVCLAKEDLSG